MKTKEEITNEISNQLTDDRIRLIWSRVNAAKNWPKEGILFFDVLPIFSNPDSMRALTALLKEQIENIDFDYMAAFESRGFLMAQPLSYMMDIPFIPLRKKGKIPPPVYTEEYELEYGVDSIEISAKNDLEGKRVVLVDDLLATGGTMSAGINLIERHGGQVEKLLFILDLVSLHPNKTRVDEFDSYKILSLNI